jgi:hypothetical protein
MSTLASPLPTRPWYRHGWVWFILGLPAAVVVAGLTTVGIAVVYQDSVVRDDWYKDGKAINQDLARDAAATRHALAATVAVDALSGDVTVDLQHGADFTPSAALTLFFAHPTQAAADQSVVLTRRQGRYHGQLLRPLAGRYHLELGAPDWRLRGSRTLPQAQLELAHD